MDFDEEKSNEDDNLENILDDIVLTEENTNFNYIKKDNTIFIVDCSP